MTTEWEFPEDRPFDLEVNHVGFFSNCRVVARRADTLIVDREAIGGSRVRVQLLIEDILAVHSRPPIVEERAYVKVEGGEHAGHL